MHSLNKIAIVGALFGTIGAAHAQERDGWTVSLGGSANPYLGQRQSLGFAQNGMAGLGYRYTGDRLGFNLSGVAEDDGEGLRPDGSYVETYAGNWAFGVGYVDRNWSPSRYSSLIMSDNARPFASAYIQKRDFTAFETPFLSWIGPWKAEVFLGQTEGDDNPDHTKLFGMRLQLQPVQGLEIDLVRTAQWGGDGLPENLDSFVDMVLGKTNDGPGAEANQLAGIGLSYTLPEQFAPIRVYAQAVGEDESGGLPSCFMYLGGIEGKADAFGTPTTITFEGATTEISNTENGFCGPGTAYNNFYYPGGYTNHGQVMGLAMDTDSRMMQLIVEHQLPQFDLHWAVGYYDINTANNPNHRLSSTNVEGAIARVGASRIFDDLRVTGEVSYQSYDLDSADIDRGLGVGFTLSRTF